MFTRKDEGSHTPTSYDPPASPASHVRESPRPASPSSTGENVISRGTRVQGDVFCEGNLRVEGKVTGNIYSRSKVTVGQNGLVEGKIECVRAELHGTIKGTLTVQDQLSLKAEAKIDGDVLTAHLEMEPTVRFNGNCTMQDKITLSGPDTMQSKKEEKPAAIPNQSPVAPSPGNKLNSSPAAQKKNIEKERFSTKTFQR